MNSSLSTLLRRLEEPVASWSDLGLPYRLARRVLYVVNHCYPFSSNGYAVRTHGVASGLKQSGCDVVVASRPGLPWDQPGFDDEDFNISHKVDGVRYVHSRTPSRRGMLLDGYREASIAHMVDLMRVFKPTVVMAASNWQNALPAAIAARELGLPFFYEVRGFWEWSRAAREPGWEHSSSFLHEVARETAVAKAAQQAFTLNRFMKEELVRRGIASDRISLVPNGFPGWAETPVNPLSRIDLGIRSQYVVGYVGSFNVYEGLEELIEALALVRQRGLDVALLLVGSGEPRGFGAGKFDACPKTTAYGALAHKLGVREFVFMPGRVSPEQAGEYYALLDAVVIPRRPFAVCELVSPMKPLEAASFGKRVLMSDVAPLTDLAGLSTNFSYFKKGDVKSLANELVALLEAPDRLPPRCSGLNSMTWDRSVSPMVAAVHELERMRNCFQKTRIR